MNLGLLMNVGAPSVPSVSSGGSSNGTSGAGFGSVYQSLMGASEITDTGQVGADGALAKMIQDIMQADSLEELAVILEEWQQDGKTTSAMDQLLKGLGSKQVSENMSITELSNLNKFPSLQQLAALITENPDKLVEVMTKALAEAGVSEKDIEQLQATGDIWFVLDTLQKLPPEQIQIAIEKLPEKVTVEITALFKAIELAAPKMDLHVKQEELIKTIQPLLSQFAGHLEEKTVQPEIKQTIQLPTAVQHMIRFTTEHSAADTKQQGEQTKSNESSTLQSVLPQIESRPVFQMTQTEKAPESRSEALMREFQAILNRANFGQTGGTNRLLVKLYPEHLGQVRIELLEVNGIMTARILASSAMAREMLDSQMHQLRHAFNQQNLQVERIDLSQTIQDPGKNEREQAFNKQNEQSKEQQTEQNDKQDEHEQTFQEFMIELEV
ncbi:flagellar hook-length control protein FliK [Sporosarcina sp.]|uniref:flagellar hook-length control protein FliK n=1 Tax=Sporosarcina sp. TaxID=49982 RepID=UPI0026338FDA|nr:flagellar hook-length control protein FliK [Sporosarcina sp.]